MEDSSLRAKIYSVTEINAEIKTILEQQFPFVWISGEVSNFRMPASGHFYFSLKDASAQISAVMFRGQNRRLTFTLEDGMALTGMGRISVYEPRGSYQIIFEHLEPKGVGALQMAFEQLKRRLEAEGLFDGRNKKPLPFLPEKIHIITSPTGAVIHDIMHVARRRFPGIAIDIIPVKVQGDSAADTIVDGIQMADLSADAEVVILARGGGSLEDLQAFNSEKVARAIYAAEVPVVCAVGHETDFTIADFVSDLRAPTPSAAAEMVVPAKEALHDKIHDYRKVMHFSINRCIEKCRTKIETAVARLIDPRNRIDDYRLKLDDAAGRLQRALAVIVERCRERFDWKIEKLYFNNPDSYIENLKEKLNNQTVLLNQEIKAYLSDRHHMIREFLAKLNALNPTDILTRGYSITRTVPDATIVRSSREVRVGQDVEVLLAKGSLKCLVKERENNA